MHGLLLLTRDLRTARNLPWANRGGAGPRLGCEPLPGRRL